MSTQTATTPATLDYVKTIGLTNNGDNGRGYANPVSLSVSGDGRIFVLNRCDPVRARAIRVGICNLEEDFLGEFGDGSGTGVDGLCNAGISCFRMQFYFTNQMGVWWQIGSDGLPVMFPGGGLVPFTGEVFGSYKQKGRNLKLRIDSAPGDEGLRRMLSDTGQLALFGARNLAQTPDRVEPRKQSPLTAQNAIEKSDRIRTEIGQRELGFEPHAAVGVA